MKNIINETEMMAHAYFKDFGFNEDQINTLIAQGKKDLYKELGKLEMLIDNDMEFLDDINNVLHALKGLFFQLGNHEVAEQLDEIREGQNSKDKLKEISELLFDTK